MNGLFDSLNNFIQPWGQVYIKPNCIKFKCTLKIFYPLINLKYEMLLFSLIPLFSYSQGINNFSLNEAEILWTKTFATNLSFDELSKAVVQSGLFDKIETIDSSLSGRTIKIYRQIIK